MQLNSCGFSWLKGFSVLVLPALPVPPVLLVQLGLSPPFVKGAEWTETGSFWVSLDFEPLDFDLVDCQELCRYRPLLG